MDRAFEYLQKIHEAVVDSVVKGLTDPIELTKKTAEIPGLPPRQSLRYLQNI
jgi:hypothetical protein